MAVWQRIPQPRDVGVLLLEAGENGMKALDWLNETLGDAVLSNGGPGDAQSLRAYLSAVRATRFRGQWTLGALLPPYPSRAFDNALAHFSESQSAENRIYCVSMGVTNRCSFNCWHCCNAGRKVDDPPLRALQDVCHEIQDLGTVRVLLTGGEPLLREDLEDICGAFDERSFVLVGTNGWGLSYARAARLKEAGVFGVGISLDSEIEAEHDRLRGRTGAFQAAVRAFDAAHRAGLYPYATVMARRELLSGRRFPRLLRFARTIGAMEVSLLEPISVGRLRGRKDVMLLPRHRQMMLKYQRLVACCESVPLLATDTHLGSAESFRCRAGVDYFHIDGSGEVCPCSVVPLSFGNITQESLSEILPRLRQSIASPLRLCLARLLGSYIPPSSLPTSPGTSARICATHLGRRAAFLGTPQSRDA